MALTPAPATGPTAATAATAPGATTSQPAQPAVKAGTVKQTVPTGTPNAPAAPAAKAPRVSKKAPDLSKLSDDERAKFEALTKELDENKKRVNEAKRQQDVLLGVAPAKRARVAGTPSLGGLNPALQITVDTQGTGFKNSEDVAIAQKIGNGKTLAEVIALDGVDFNWIRHRFIRNSLKINGMTYVEAINKASGLPSPAMDASAAATASA